VSDNGLCIIGVDVGIANCGVAVYRPSEPGRVYANVIRTAKKHGSDTERLQRIMTHLPLALIGVGEASEVVVALEMQHGGRSPKIGHDTARGPAAVRGLFTAIATTNGWRIVEVTPAAAKRAMTGSAKATKEQVQAMAEKRFGEEKLAFDAADAAAIALAAEGELKMRTLRGEEAGQ
jgi:crossover junction endodeoxyribonuclease RuvC